MLGNIKKTNLCKKILLLNLGRVKKTGSLLFQMYLNYVIIFENMYPILYININFICLFFDVCLF